MTAAEGRRFAFTVGAAFLVLATVAWWRDHPTSSRVLGGMGSAMWAAGILVPRHLAPVERAWMGLAHAMSRVTTPVFMGVVYFVVLFPIGLLRRTIGANPIRHQPVERSLWKDRPEGARRSQLERQF